MRSFPKINFNTFFSRILFFNIILVTLVTLIPQAIYVSYFKTNFDKEINKYNLLTVKQVQKSLDEKIIEKTITLPVIYFSDIKSNKELIYPLNNDINNDATSILNIKERLDDIKNSYEFINTIGVYYTKSNILISNGGVQYLNDPGSSKAFNIEWINNIIKTNASFAWIPTDLMRDEMGGIRSDISYLQSIPFYASRENRNAIVIISIKQAALKELYADALADNDQQFIIVNKESKVISNSGTTEFLKQVNNSNIIEKVLKSGREGIFQAKINNKISMISFSESKYCDWKYISITAVDAFYSKSYQMRNFLILLSVLLFVINLSVSIWITKKANKPLNLIIRNVKNITKPYESIGHPEKINEYKLLSSTINNLADQVDDLNQKLDINKPVIRHSAIRNLLNGKNNDCRKGNYEIFDIKFTRNTFVSFILKIYSDRGIGFENEMLINYSIIELLEKKTDRYIIKAITDDDGVVAGIINFDLNTDISWIINDILHEIANLLKVKFTLCIGNSYTGEYEMIQKSYTEALECFKYTFLKPDCRVLIFSELHIDDLKDMGSSERILERIAESIRSGDAANLEFLIDSVIEAVKSGAYSIDFCKNTLADIVSIIRTNVMNIGWNEYEAFGCDIRDSYKVIRDIDEFKLWIHKITDIIVEKSNEKRLGMNKELETKVLQFIEENIYKDLSQDMIADQLGVSPYQLNKLLRMAKGKNYVDYVTELKLQCAVKLLREEKITVQDISNKLGYNSVHYFIKIFKGKYGYTPKQYQKFMMNEK